MDHTQTNLIPDEEEETMATPRFDAAPAPKRVVPLERIRARTASAVRRVRYRVQPSAQKASGSNWLPYIALVILAGVAGGFLLAMNGRSEFAEDAPVVGSELEAETNNLNAATKKSAFVERGNQTTETEAPADFKAADAPPEIVDQSVDKSAERETTGNKLLTVEEEPKVTTEIDLRNSEKASKQVVPLNENERLELIRKDAERQAAREREERNRLGREPKTDEKPEEKPKGDEQNKKPEQTENNRSEDIANTDQL